MPRSSLLAKRRLRTPFVATVATVASAAALLPACGGKSADDPPPAANDGCVDSGIEASTECPATLPAEGTPCNVTGVCGGGGCDTTYATGQIAVCVNGAWRIQSGGGCNPPACACPAQVPTPGTSCASCAGAYPTILLPGTSQTFNCAYDMCLGFPQEYATCDPTTGQWDIGHTSCNPPPPIYDAGPTVDEGGLGPDGEGPDVASE